MNPNEQLSEPAQQILNTLTEMHRRTLFEHENRLARRSETAAPTLSRLLVACAEDNVHRTLPAVWAASLRISERLGRPPTPGCVFVERDLQAATGSAGGYLKGLQIAPGNFFGQTMADTSLSRQLGVPEVPVTNDAQFPRVVTPPSVTWMTNETTAVSESSPTFGTAATSPKTVGTYIEATRHLLRQSTAAVSAFLEGELARALQHAVNAALVNGSGAAGQPTGILNTSGIGSQSGTSLAWAGVAEMMRLVEAAGPFMPARGAWVVGTAAAKLLRSREVAAGAGLVLAGGRIDAYPAYVTTAMPSDALLFGDFSGVVMPHWGVLELGSDPYAADGGAGFRTGVVGLRALTTVDVAVLRPAGFAKATSVT
jgi:HK97 family phage major capsid protein